MKRSFVIGLCLVASLFASAAQANGTIPLPRERPPELVLAQAQNPDPFNVNRANAAPTQTSTSTQGVAPIIVTPPAAHDGILSYIQTAIMALLTAIFGKLAFKLPSLPAAPGAAPASSGDASTSQISLALKAALHPSGTSIISDPALRTKVDQALLQIIQSGLPGSAIQTGISLIPGAGAIGGLVEPLVRKAVEAALEARLGQQPTAGQSTATDQLQPVIDQFKPLLDQLKTLIEAKAQHPVAPPVA